MIVVVPTRNRADLAMRAARSVAGARLLISDNSTDEGERARLAAWCAERGIEVVRPPRPLAMGDHWEWACEQASARAPDEHLTLMTDRMVWKRGALAKLLRVCAAEPARVVTFLHDAVFDDVSPIRVHLVPWTGEVVEIATREQCELFVHGRRHLSTPRLLNCAVPAAVVRAVRARFGTLCTGQSPDYAFAFRVMALEPSVLHIVEALQVANGMARSNGLAYARGVFTKEALDFKSYIPAGQEVWASPVPGLMTPLNGITHEYMLVRQRAPELPEIDLDAVLAALAREARALAPDAREDALARLRAAGWRPNGGAGGRAALVRRVRRAAAFRRPVDRARRAVGWACRALRERTGVALLDARRFVYDDVEEALRAVDDWPRAPEEPADALTPIRRFRA